MPIYDLRILLETVEGNKTSYYSSGSNFLPNNFINTTVDGNFMSASMVRDRVRRMVSASYLNESTFRGQVVNGADGSSPNYFSGNTLLSATLSGSDNTGSIVFTALDNEYDRLLRYKFIGEKVTNVLGLPSDQWIYVDQVRLPVDDEANVFQGNANLGNVNISDTLTFAGGSDVNSDVPFLIDTGSDRYIKFVDERATSIVALRMGYDTDRDVYEISGSDNFTFKIGGLDTLDGNITSSTFLFQENVDGGDTTITIFNSNQDGGTDKGAGIEFKHAQNAVASMKPAGKIIAGKDNGYQAAGGAPSQDSNLQFFTALNGTDTERLRIDSNGLAIFTGDISASGDIIGNRYIVNSTVSTITQSFSSGSTIFGDTPADDTHQFTGSVFISGSTGLDINGNITASGNISASGTAHTIGGTTTLGDIVNFGSIIRHTGDTNTRITFATDKITLRAGGVDMITLTEDSTDTIALGAAISSHITASGNISSSGHLHTKHLILSGGSGVFTSASLAAGGSGGSADNLGNHTATQDLNLGGNDIFGVQHITASGRISASGNILTTANVILQANNQLKLNGDLSDDRIFYSPVNGINIDSNEGTSVYNKLRVDTFDNSGKSLTVGGDISASGDLFVDDIAQVQHITASGNISSSGDVIARSGSFDVISKVGDDDTKITFTDDDINITVGGVNMIDITQDTVSEITFNEGSADLDFRVEGNGDANLLFTNAGTDKVGIGTNSPSKKLHVVGAISASQNIFIGNGGGTDERKIIHSGDEDTHLLFDANKVNLVAGGSSAIKLDTSTGKIIINNTNSNLDTQIMADNGEVILHTDAGMNSVGINTVVPITGSTAGLTVEGGISASGDILNTTTVQMTNSSSVINTFNTASHQTCKYVLQVTSGSHIQSSEMLVMQNSSNAFNTEYSQINSGLNLLNFTSKVNGANVELIGSSSFISCSVKFNRTLI